MRADQAPADQARAEAKAQRLQRETLTPIMLQLCAIEKWDGKLSQVSGGAVDRHQHAEGEATRRKNSPGVSQPHRV